MTWAVSARRLVVSAVMMTVWPASVVQSNDRAPLTARVAPIQISKPGQLALAPAGDRLAITDRFANRIVVLDSRGTLLWSVGEGVTLNQPHGVMMVDAATLVFSQWGSCEIFKVSEKAPQVIDTIAELSASLGDRARVKRLYKLQSALYLVLTENPDRLVQYAADWTAPREIIKEGSGKGKLDRSADCVLLPAGRVAVAGGGHNPIQLFDLSGRFLTSVDWNSPAPVAGWIASAVAIDQRERIWASDLTNGKFRLYDLAGTPVYDIPFASPLAKPCDMAVTSDNQLFVLDDNGRLEIYDLGQE